MQMLWNQCNSPESECTWLFLSWFHLLLAVLLQEKAPQVKRSSSPPKAAPKKRTAFIDITNVSPLSAVIVE